MQKEESPTEKSPTEKALFEAAPGEAESPKLISVIVNPEAEHAAQEQLNRVSLLTRVSLKFCHLFFHRQLKK